MSTIKNSFNSLDNKVARFADKSINLGNQLSSYDKEKESAILTSELIDYFMAFNTHTEEEYPEIFKNKEHYLTAAKYIYYLQEISKSLTTSEYNTATTNINF